MRHNARLILIAFVVSAASMQGQTAETMRGPDNGPRVVIPGIEVPPNPGLPFSGVDTTIWTRTTEGGGTTTLYLTAKVVRDGQGRLYRERHHFDLANADPAKTMYEFSIYDPVAGTSTHCRIAEHLCNVRSYTPHFSTAVVPVGPFDNNRRYLARESLGTQTLDDLPVTGTLETVTIAPGTTGNDREAVYSREFWYSADLKTNLAVTRKDPHNGTQAIRLNVQSRSEPEPSIFAIPAGYAIKDERMSVAAIR